MQTNQPSTSEITLGVILGARQFPKATLTSSQAFENSAREFAKYLLADEGLGISTENLLDLFDSADPAPSLDERLAYWLQERQSILKARGISARDLIVYYVGHGGFSNPGDHYFLALRDTRSGNEYHSSYSISALSNTLREYARNLRKVLIFDSCFSAAAQMSFQSAGPLEVAKRQTLAEFPAKGTALLCASGPKDPAKTLPEQRLTMFSGALLQVLKEGSVDLGEKMSLFEVAEETRTLIKANYPEEAVRPEFHSPDQRNGDVGVMPLFPNPVQLSRIQLKKMKEMRELIDNKDNQNRELSTEVTSLTAKLALVESKLAEAEKRCERLGIIENASGHEISATAQEPDDLPSPKVFGIPQESWVKFDLPTQERIESIYIVRSRGRYILIIVAPLFMTCTVVIACRFRFGPLNWYEWLWGVATMFCSIVLLLGTFDPANRRRERESLSWRTSARTAALKSVAPAAWRIARRQSIISIFGTLAEKKYITIMNWVIGVNALLLVGAVVFRLFLSK